MNVLRIGVTGHRILAQNHGLENGIQEVIAKINLAFPLKPWILYSSLAEGADCLFVQFALRQPAVELFVPLPLPVQEYLEDFHSDESRSIFAVLYQQASDTTIMPPQANREEAFRAAGEYIVHHSDILVAIWDGKKEQGTGGTGYVVKFARQQNLPLAWIKAGNRKPGTLHPTHLGKQQGEVELVGFPSNPTDPSGTK